MLQSGINIPEEDFRYILKHVGHPPTLGTINWSDGNQYQIAGGIPLVAFRLLYMVYHDIYRTCVMWRSFHNVLDFFINAEGTSSSVFLYLKK